MSRRKATAGVGRIARKLIALEWARAMGRGRSRFDQEVAEFERQAAEYKQEKAKRDKLEAQARRRATRLIGSLQESLAVFTTRLCELPAEERGESAEGLLCESLRSVGDVDYMHWSPGGCEITFEPWVERRARRKIRAAPPALFRASVDDQLRLTGCAPLTGEEYKASRPASMLGRILAALRGHGRTPEALQDALGQMGRVIHFLTMKDGSIKASVEPWEELRRRRLERSPIRAYAITTDAALESIRCEPC